MGRIIVKKKLNDIVVKEKMDVVRVMKNKNMISLVRNMLNFLLIYLLFIRIDCMDCGIMIMVISRLVIVLFCFNVW